MLQVKNLSFSYQKKKVLEDINFTVKSGETVALIGPNGSGKTTLIQNILNLLSPDAGQIQINGTSNQTPGILKNIVYIAGNDYLPLFLTGQEYLSLLAKLHEKSIDQDQCKRLLDYYDLTSAFDQNLERYSHGMKKKIQLVSSLLIHPDLLIVDETLNGLDIVAREITKSLFNQYVARGGTLFLCTHDFSLVEELACRAILISEGKIKYDAGTHQPPQIPLAQLFYDLLENEEKTYVL